MLRRIQKKKANLASCLSRQGKYAEAAAMTSDVLAAKRRVNGHDHPDTLMTAGNMAQVAPSFF